MLSIDYKGKIVLVTGGGRGIGLAITRAFAEGGATVVITYNSSDPSSTAASVSSEFGVPVHVYHCPGEKSKIVDEVVERVSKEVGEIDIVIANAGVSMWKDSIDMTDSELDKIMQTNLYAPIYLTRAITRQWLNVPVKLSEASDVVRGQRDEQIDLKKKIILISSISGQIVNRPQCQMAYNASKAGLTMVGKCLAGEWAKYGIQVNMVSPGYVLTDMIENPPPGEGEEWVKLWKELTPRGKFALPKEVGDFVAVICSDRAGSHCTGAEYTIDGGYTIW